MNQLIIIFIILIISVAIVVSMLLYFSTRVRVFNPDKFEPLTLENIENINDKKTQRVVVFNSFSYKDDKLPSYANYSTDVNKLYCDKYGYDYIQINHPIDEMPPYWLRVKDTYELLMKTDYEAVVYLDLDAVFYDFNKPLEAILANEYDFYIGQDPPKPMFSFGEANNLLNSGCYIVKNTRWSKEFLRDWLYACVGDKGESAGVCKHDWKFNNGKWNCDGCAWAGVKYEQGSLASLYLANVKNAQKHICILEKSVLSNTDPSIPSFVLHLMGSDNSEREKIFKRVLNDHSHNQEHPQ